MNADHPPGFTLDLVSDAGPMPADCPVDIAELKVYAIEALQNQNKLAMGAIDRVEISVQCLNVEAMRALNKQYRWQDKPTNVLSFESGMPALTNDKGERYQLLGDIIFCPALIADEAQQQAKPCSWHWGHLMVHGTLHLCGYDHMKDDEAQAMEALEIKILSTSGINNPYQTQTDK